VDYVAVENVLGQEGAQLRREKEEEENSANILPVHMRCAAHILNLKATADANKALEDSVFKYACRKAMAKAHALWNAPSRSTQFADIIQEELNRRLVFPNTTRWIRSMTLLWS
jgi:hypothetical protein